MERTRNNSEDLKIWQWNCRSLKKKRGAFSQYIASIDKPPHVIALQEVGKEKPSIAGYNTYMPDREGGRVATLVAKHVTVKQHEVGGTSVEHNIIEIIPSKKETPSFFIMNIYSPPSSRKDVFHKLFEKVIKLSDRRLLIIGDFNAPHPAWGYRQSVLKGTKLYEAVNKLHLTMLTDPSSPTRIGNSVEADTTPDLAFIMTATGRWVNTEQSFGSDHTIAEIEVSIACSKKYIRKQRITDWNRFREERALLEGPESDNDLTQWTKRLSEHERKYTREISITDEIPEVDSRLVNLWEARHSLVKRWKRQKLNRKLKAKIAQITAKALEHADVLARSNWHQKCNAMQGTLGTARTWSLLRHLLDPANNKQQTKHTIKKIVHDYPGTNEELIRTLKERYIGEPTEISYPEYRGRKNEELDEEIQANEVIRAAQELTRNTAPGKDRIQNKLLKNLDLYSYHKLTEYMNQVWRSGELPKEWKHAEITLIPKPGKRPDIENLRPISLTSCIGKLMEHVILNRLQPYLEDKGVFTDTMFGFRPRLSTQDVFLQIKEDILEPAARPRPQTVVALDIKGAFDNVGHELILNNLESTGCGERMYNYVRDFLRERTATIGIGEIRSETLKVPNKGTPQGSVLSPTLFNLAMAKLPERLSGLEYIKHSIYADDLTLWTTGGSAGQKQDGLQEAVEVVQEYLESGNLRCAPEKSEIITIKGQVGNDEPEIKINLKDGTNIPRVQHMRVLGMHLQSNGKAAYSVKMLGNTITQISHMMSRVSSRQHGLKEPDLIKMVQALLVSRILYAAPYLRLTRGDREKIDVMIKKAYKQALGLPVYTPNEKLMALGVHNTYMELASAHLASQRERLAETRTGRAVLGSLRIPVPHTMEKTEKLPKEIRAQLSFSPIPKNMHSEINKGRREARAKAIKNMAEKAPIVLYTDAAIYPDKKAATVAVVDKELREVNIASIRATEAAEAEEVAIALAIIEANAKNEENEQIIITDSQTAIKRLRAGLASQLSIRLLQKHPTSTRNKIRIVWTPGHESVEGNEAAHASARAGVNRAPNTEETDEAIPVVNKYSQILEYLRDARRRYPPPHKELARDEATAWRQIQTGTFPNLALLNKISPTRYNKKCPHCEEYADLYHTTWACMKNPTLPHDTTQTVETWETSLTSLSLDDQRALVNRARAAAESSGALDRGPRPGQSP